MTQVSATRPDQTVATGILDPATANARRQRFKHLADAMAATPPDPAYLAEAQEWQSDAWN